MRLLREAIDLQWDGAPTAADLPVAAVAGLVLTIYHAAALLPWEAVRHRMTEAFGLPTRERRSWRATHAQYDGKLPVDVELRRGRVIVRGRSRVRPKQLQKLVQALRGLPGVTRVTLRGTADRYGSMERPMMGDA